MVDAQNFGSIIRRIREGKGLNQEDMARIFEVERSTISQWETGRSFPDETKLARLAEMGDMDVETLVGLKQAILLAKKGIDLSRLRGQILTPDESEVVALYRKGDWTALMEIIWTRMRKTA